MIYVLKKKCFSTHKKTGSCDEQNSMLYIIIKKIFTYKLQREKPTDSTVGGDFYSFTRVRERNRYCVMVNRNIGNIRSFILMNKILKTRTKSPKKEIPTNFNSKSGQISALNGTWFFCIGVFCNY